MDTETIIKVVIASIIILVIVILIYMIISYFINAWKSSKPQDTGEPDQNVLDFNKFIAKKALDSKNLSPEYIQKYKVVDNYSGYGNYNVISNIHDNRNVFQAPDGDFYINIKE
jgi:hypothetical protein